jgi:predicted DNA-binding transcriptional regulator AlpA
MCVCTLTRLRPTKLFESTKGQKWEYAFRPIGWRAFIMSTFQRLNAMPKKTTQKSLRLVHKPEVLARIGVTYQTIWRWMKQKKFPACRHLGEGFTAKVVWYEHEIDEWLANIPSEEK